ncbi:hypothetical protein D3C72_1220800 [compost metagenome]
MAFLSAVLQRDADEDLGRAIAGPAIVELGHRAAVEAAQEAVIVVAAVGHGHGQQGLGALADLGPLGHVAQAVEVDIGARIDRHQGARAGMTRRPDLHARQGHGARGLGHSAHVVEDVLHRRADGVRVDQDDVVQQVAAQAEGLVAGSAHRYPVGEQADLIQGHHMTGVDGALHRRGVGGFDADDLRLGAQETDDGRHPRRQTAAADRDEDGVDRVGVLAQDLQPDRALSGDHVRVVERVDEGCAGLLFQGAGVGVGVVEAVAVQDDVSAERLDRRHLDARRGGRHDDGRGRAAFRRRQRHALRVIARRGADDAARQLGLAQGGDLVVGAANLEREDRLQVLALQQGRAVQPRRQPLQRVQRGFLGHVIDAGGQDAADGVLHEKLETAR